MTDIQTLTPPPQHVVATRLRNFIRANFYTTPPRCNAEQRQLCAHILYQDHGFTVHQIACFFSCSVRTVYRDLQDVEPYLNTRKFKRQAFDLRCYLYHYTKFPKA